jgi:ABC-2 type transport system ATP-binding protein
MSDFIIEATELTKTFGNIKAVDNISFNVNRGEIFAFLGPNGAGKSTTIKMLTTLLQPTSGQIILAGHDVVKKQDAARKAFGIVFQDPSVDDELTAYENMWLHAILYSVPKRDINPRISELLKLVELWDRRDSRVKTFSGGMKRRLEIARGLLHHPELLFLDEPTIGLDTQTRNLLWEYIKTLSRTKHTTIFFTTHYLEEAENIAESIAIIDNGKIIASGTVEHLKKTTNSKTLEAAYLKLTGKQIRDEQPGGNQSMRFRNRIRSGGRS